MKNLLLILLFLIIQPVSNEQIQQNIGFQQPQIVEYQQTQYSQFKGPAKAPWRDDYYDPLRARPYYRLLHAKGEDAKLKNLMYSQALNAASDTYSKIINEEI